MLDLHRKRFSLISNSAGEARPGETFFDVEQNAEAIRIAYSGGGVRLGAMIGTVVAEDLVAVHFQHIAKAGDYATGEAELAVSRISGGKLRIDDNWRFVSGAQGSGQAVWHEE